MRLTACRLLCAALAVVLQPGLAAESRLLHIDKLEVHVRAGDLPDLVCPKPPGAAQPKPPAPSPLPELVLPEADEVVAALEADRAESPESPERPERADTALEGDRLRPLSPTDGRLRIGVWGDSHIAAAFFTDELARVLAAPDRPARSRFMQAGFGHPGVRGLVRKSCVSAGWMREAGHARRSAAATPGPGLVTLVSEQASAMLNWDLRDAAGQPQYGTLQLLYDATNEAARIGIRVDGGEEQVVALPRGNGPAAIELDADAPLSLLQIRLLNGTLRFQGLRFEATPALQLDVFGYPGATMAGWAGMDLDYFRGWFDDETYDLVLLAFGTNEANDPEFKPERYRASLTQAVQNLRRFAPGAGCLLLAPGDRGVKVPVSRVKRAVPARANTSGKSSKPAQSGKYGNPGKSGKSDKDQRATRLPRVDLLKYAHLHQAIAVIQRQVAAAEGCQAWSAQAAMGGIGSAYGWARSVPPLMAPDLLHFTAAGYRKLAHRLAADLGWER